MTTQKKETRPYKFFNKYGLEETMYVAYHLVFKDGRLESVFNTAHINWGHSIEEDSECFQYFNEKYNQL